jgi:phosphoglycerate-specific signal transduction histidine kinase
MVNQPLMAIHLHTKTRKLSGSITQLLPALRARTLSRIADTCRRMERIILASRSFAKQESGL